MFSLPQVAVGSSQLDNHCYTRFITQLLFCVGFGMFDIMPIACHYNDSELCFPLTSF
jgi:hypothetical protein